MTLPSSAELYAAAQGYAARGWRTIPLHAVVGGVCTCARPNCNSSGKHPVETRWQGAPKMSGADIYATWGEDGAPQRNVGIATGAASGIWVLDLDYDKPGTEEAFRALVAEHDEAPRTYTVRTGGGGWQLYFAMPDFNVTNSARRLPAGVDVRGTGGQVVAPPSVSGKGPYRLAVDAPVVRAPVWLEELVRPLPPAAPVDLETQPKLTDLPASEQQRLAGYVDRVITAEIGRLRECREKGWGGPGWNQTTFEVSCSLVELANSPWSPMTLPQARDIVLASAPRDPGFTDADVEGCFASALKKVAGGGRAMPEGRPTGTVYPGDPLSDPDWTPSAGPTPTDGEPAAPPVRRRPMTDLGNAERLLDLFRGELLYVAEAKEWAVYTDGVWAIQANAGRSYAQTMIKGLIGREGHLYDDSPRVDAKGKEIPSELEEFAKWAMGQQMSARIDAAAHQATALPEFQASLEDFDTEHHLLNCANGIVDLRTGELMEHTPDHRMMLQTAVRYDPTVEHPRWDAFLDRCQPDTEMQDYLQEVMGYSLTGSLAEQAMFLHHGAQGSNGKSVYLVVAALLAGGYSQTVPRETLLVKQSGAEHPTSVARMRGKRFLQASETGIGRRLDEETVKGLTGGEQQSARYMGKDFFEFTPTGKIHLITNHLPKVSDANSMWRRMHLIGWRETIGEDEQNPAMLEASYWAEEAPGILAWAVAGEVRRFARPRLVMPASMKRDIADYRTDQDILGEFIEARLEPNEMAFTAASDIFAAYSTWAFNQGIKMPLTAPDLRKQLKERGLVEHRTAKARGFRVKLDLPNRVLTSADV